MLEVPNYRRKSNIVPPNLPTVPSGVAMGSEAFELSEEPNDLKESGEQQEVQHYPKLLYNVWTFVYANWINNRLQQSFRDKDGDPSSSHRI